MATKLTPEDVQLYYQIGLLGQRDLDLAPDPRSGFEMVMLRMLTFGRRPTQRRLNRPRLAQPLTNLRRSPLLFSRSLFTQR